MIAGTLCQIVAKYHLDVDDKIQDFQGRLFEREVEKAILKAWGKVFSKEALEELETRNIVVSPPAIFFERAGETQRIATVDDDGRDTSADAVFEDDQD